MIADQEYTADEDEEFWYENGECFCLMIVNIGSRQCGSLERIKERETQRPALAPGLRTPETPIWGDECKIV